MPRDVSKKRFAEFRVASVFIMGAAPLGEMVLPLMNSNLFQIDKLVFVFVSFSQDFVLVLVILDNDAFDSVLLFSSAFFFTVLKCRPIH